MVTDCPPTNFYSYALFFQSEEQGFLKKWIFRKNGLCNNKNFLLIHIQSALVISTSVISNNRLSRRENVVLVLTQKSKIRLQNIVEKRRNCSWGAISTPFHNIFNIYFQLKESNYIVICKFWLFKLFFPQYYKSDMSKYGYLEVFLRVPSISR